MDPTNPFPQGLPYSPGVAGKELGPETTYLAQDLVFPVMGKKMCSPTPLKDLNLSAHPGQESLHQTGQE